VSKPVEKKEAAKPCKLAQKSDNVKLAQKSADGLQCPPEVEKAFV